MALRGLLKKTRKLRHSVENVILRVTDSIRRRRSGVDFDRQFPPMQAICSFSRFDAHNPSAEGFLAAASKHALIFPDINLTGLPANGLLSSDSSELLKAACEYAEGHSLQCTLRLGGSFELISSQRLLSLAKRVENAKEVALGFSNRDTSIAFQIRFYLYNRDNDWLTCRASRSAIKKVSLESLPKGIEDVSGNITGYDIDTRSNFPIDAVFTWVNHHDAKWQELIRPYKSEVNWDRYLESDELRYSMRSVARYAPWIRNIYILTNCQRPHWLAEHPKIHWVDHSEVFEAKHLPTFNSHAIESNLARIPGLSENFIYFNDDVFLGGPSSPDDFFTSNGMSIAYLEPYGMVLGEDRPDMPDYLRAAIRGRKLIERKFARSPIQLHLHAPHSVCKSVFLEMEAEFQEAFERVRKNKFRHETDISPVSFLYHHYGYQRRAVIRSLARTALVTVRNYKAYSIDRLAAMQFICINDGGGSAEDKDFQVYKREVLQKLFPWRAEWEV